MKSFRERNPIIIGTISVAVLALVTAGLLGYNSLPFTSPGKTYRAYFEELGGLATGAPVEVAGAGGRPTKKKTPPPPKGPVGVTGPPHNTRRGNNGGTVKKK